jgi:beta-RFAP synthase
MFSFGRSDRPQFGGMGAMIEPPAIEVTITPANHFGAIGCLTSRVERFATFAAQSWRLNNLPACQIEVTAPIDHVGLGVGTQLGLAIAAGMREFLELPSLPIDALAASVGRGSRSAVGTYGFEQGGLIVDAGKLPGRLIGALARRVELPADWRFVLVRPADGRGLAGEHETDAFARLAPVADSVSAELWRLTDCEILPALARADCAAFGEAVYRFGRLAGECFAAVQHGPFASEVIAELVRSIREFGVAGVGQSSWGPTVFAVTASQLEAQALAEWLGEALEIPPHNRTIARPNNRGAETESE